MSSKEPPPVVVQVVVVPFRGSDAPPPGAVEAPFKMIVVSLIQISRLTPALIIGSVLIVYWNVFWIGTVQTLPIGVTSTVNWIVVFNSKLLGV